MLQAFLARPADWRYGYDLTKEIGLRSGTLYPVLIRLADKGLLDSNWHQSDRPGAPPRHAYRMTSSGIAFALAHAEATPVVQGGQGAVPA